MNVVIRCIFRCKLLITLIHRHLHHFFDDRYAGLQLLERTSSRFLCNYIGAVLNIRFEFAAKASKGSNEQTRRKKHFTFFCGDSWRSGVSISQTQNLVGRNHFSLHPVNFWNEFSRSFMHRNSPSHEIRAFS